MRSPFEAGFWRGIIGDDFTFAAVGSLAQSYAQVMGQGKRVVVGYDTRFQAAKFAQRAAEVLAANGLEVHLSKSYLPTPALVFATKHLQADGGLMITAGDSPAEYQGVRIISPQGLALEPSGEPGAFDPSQPTIPTFDIRKPYFEHLMGQLDLETLRAYQGVVYHDSLGGAGSGWVAGFVKQARLSLELRELHAVPEVMFYGVRPSLEAKNLFTISTLLKAEEGQTFALITNGDASQVGVVLAGGRFLNAAETARLASSEDALLTAWLLVQKAAQSGVGFQEITG